MTIIETIGRGLDARERAKTARNPKLSDLAAAPKDIAAIKNLTASATQQRDRLRTIAELVTDAVGKFRAQKTAEFAEIGDEYISGDAGVFLTPVFRFHQCLAYCRACETVDEEKRLRYIDRIETTIRSFEHMAEHSPSTYLHQAKLCKAELARMTGNVSDAMNLYDEAILSARDGGFRF